MTTFLLNLAPDAAVLLLTLGLALIALELNRPGIVLPGATGLLFTLLSCATLIHDGPDPLSIGMLLSATGILLLQLRCRIALWIPGLGTIAGIVGFDRIVPHVHRLTGFLCGLFLGAGTTVLTRLAQRARQNKGLD